MERVTIKANFVGVDDWSRCVILTDGGTRLCDVNCLDPEVIKADPGKGYWHTIIGTYDEPGFPIKPHIDIELNPE